MSALPSDVSASGREFVVQQLADLPRYPNAEGPYLRYRAYLLVLLDLLRQGWTYHIFEGQFYLDLPKCSISEIVVERA